MAFFFLFHSLLLHVFLFFVFYCFCFVLFLPASQSADSPLSSPKRISYSGDKVRNWLVIHFFIFFCMLLQTYHHQPSDNSRVFFIWFFAHDFLQSPLSPFKMFFPLLHLLLCSFDSRQERSTGLGNYIR